MKKIIPFLMCMIVALLACEKDTPNPPASVDSMQFEGVTTTLNEGEDINLSQYLVIAPASVGDTVTVEWSSNNEEIATVSASGSVEALRAGDVTITAKAMDKTAQVKLTIDKVKIKEFTIPATLEVYVGEKIKFPINDLKPKKAPLYRFEWEADNDGKEPTYSEGKWYLKADKEREYTLTVSVDDADDAKCNVKFVKPSVSKLTFNPTSYTVEEAGSLSLKTNLQITAAEGFKSDTVKVTWSSSKESVATIDQNGKVQAIAAGKATITAKAGGKTATCTVEVTAKPAPEDPEDPEKPEDPSDPMDPSDPEIPVDPENPTFTITFNANGGEGTMESITVNEGESVTIPECGFTRAGYSCEEWNTSIYGGGTAYQPGNTFIPTESITLYAKWLKCFTISFNANGGKGTMESITVKEGESVTLPTNEFTRSSYNFNNWNTSSDGFGLTYNNKSTIDVTSSMVLYAQWVSAVGEENGYEWIDLGLPSGTKWATMNVGATSPEDYGDYFAWGETETKSLYSQDNYKYYEKGYYESYTPIKYSTEDNLTILQYTDDAARVNWGGTWRTPSPEQYKELIDNSTYTWTTQKGVEGWLITSNINGNSIFFPAAGKYSYEEFVNPDSNGYVGFYWTRTIAPTTFYPYEQVYILELKKESIYMGDYSYDFRFGGLPVRAVLKK